MTDTARALRILDEVQHLTQLDAFTPAPFLAAMGEAVPAVAETLDGVAGQLDRLRAVLGEIDRFAQKSMRIRLNHLSEALPQQLRTLLQTTIVAYEREPELLRSRVAAMLGRLDRASAATLTEQVTRAAGDVLATRAALRDGVLEAAQRTAAARLPAVQRAARDRLQGDEERERWNRARVDLEQVAARGVTIERGSFTERMEQVTPAAAATSNEAEPEADPTARRFSLLELD